MSEQILLLSYYQKGVIYLIENIQNHKKYIGYTSNKNPEKYIENHFKDALKRKDLKKNPKGKYLYNAIRKYGKENFKWRILGEVYETFNNSLKENLDEAEIECIYFYRTFGSDGEHEDNIYGYNRTKGGDGVDKGTIPWIKGLTKNTSEIIRRSSEKLSKTRIQLFLDEELIVWNKGKTKETDLKLQDVSIKVSEKMNSENWKATVGKETVEKTRRTKNESNWKNTIGKETIKKISDTMNNSEWKETTGKEAIAKMKETISDPVWKATTGKDAIESYKKTVHSEDWLNTTGKEKIEKQLKTKSDPIWKETVEKPAMEKISKKRIEEGIAKGGKNPRAKKVINLDTNQIFDCIKDASEYYNMHRNNIIKCCNNKKETCKLGFHWKFLN
jgi:SOS response regulatory protein OraA/RecX